MLFFQLLKVLGGFLALHANQVGVKIITKIDYNSICNI